MLQAIGTFIAALSPRQLRLSVYVLVAIVGAVDLATGRELSFSIFYAIPVGIGSWYAGKRFGLVVCVASAATWLASDWSAGFQYSHPAIPLWNAGVRLGFFVIIAYLFDRLHSSMDLQESLAQLDGLTGMMNARAFKTSCETLFELASRHDRPLALGYLDLDGFKGVNDRLGHTVGDEVLKAVAAALGQRLRASDLGGRLGGDEFAVLLPETDLAGARAFFTGLRESLSDLAASKSWPVGFSIGVAVFRPPTTTPDDAIRLADGLMYKVKNSGKGSILFEEFAGASRVPEGT
jgi:diguanylate cyclase (GGDEF)-like protein